MYRAKNWKYGGPANPAELVTISVVVAKCADHNDRRYIEDAIRALTLYKNTLPNGAAHYWVKEITIT